MSIRSMTRRRKVIAGVAALLVAVTVVAWLEWPRDEAVPASVDDVVRGFRERAALGQEQQSGLPEFGVYVYAISGSETLEAAVIEQTHPYDGTVALVIESDGCGVREHLQILTTRWNETVTCRAGDRLRLAAVGEHHEFFGTVSSIAYRCRGEQPRAHDYRVGDRWAATCEGSQGSSRVESEVASLQAIEVTAEPVDAAEVRSRLTFDGEVSGVTFVTDWRRRSDGLLLQRKVETNADVDVLGGGSYRESYTVTLLSDEPRK